MKKGDIVKNKKSGKFYEIFGFRTREGIEYIVAKQVKGITASGPAYTIRKDKVVEIEDEKSSSIDDVTKALSTVKTGQAYKKPVKKEKKGMDIRGTKFLNTDEIQTIHEECKEVLGKYGLSIDLINRVEVTKLLKTSAGNIKWKLGSTDGFIIKLAHNNYMEFGFGSMIKTLRHELAHLIAVIKYNERGHGEAFKRVCADVGGHMNPKIAGNKYATYATNDYCKVQYKYEYICPICGTSYKRKFKIKKLYQYTCGKCDTKLQSFECKVLS